MIKEAMEYFLQKAATRIEEANGRLYSTERIYAIEEPKPASIEVKSLSGLVGYVSSQFDTATPLLIHVSAPDYVTVSSALNIDAQRSIFIVAKAQPPKFQFGSFLDSEAFIIGLQSVFVPTSDRETILRVVGNLRDEQVATFGDDGVSQQVTAKTGIATVSSVKVPNPVRLAPYRTFTEVAQPESDFVLRMQTGAKCALFEADGGAWRTAAMHNVAQYLQFALQTEIGAGDVTVIA